LVIGFIEYLQIVQVTIAPSLTHILCNSLQHALSFFSLLCLHRLPGKSLQPWHRTAWQHRFWQFSYCCVTSPLTRPLPRNSVVTNFSLQQRRCFLRVRSKLLKEHQIRSQTARGHEPFSTEATKAISRVRSS
jgi:hypothetical protein